jgi:hypothetical protein
MYGATDTCNVGSPGFRVSMFTVLWNVTPCSVINHYRSFGAIYSLHLHHSEYSMLLDMWYTYSITLITGLLKDPWTTPLVSGGKLLWLVYLKSFPNRTGDWGKQWHFSEYYVFNSGTFRIKNKFFNRMSKTITANSIRKCKLIRPPPLGGGWVGGCGG